MKTTPTRNAKRRLRRAGAATLAFLTAVTAFGALTMPTTASAAEYDLHKQITEQEQFGLGLGSRVQFTIGSNAPVNSLPGWVTGRWGVSDTLDARFSDVRVEKFELVNPDDPAETFSFPADPTGWVQGYQESFDSGTNTLRVWLSQTALYRQYNDPVHRSTYGGWHPLITVSAVVESVGDGIISNDATGRSDHFPPTDESWNGRTDGTDCVELDDDYTHPLWNNPPCLFDGVDVSEFYSATGHFVSESWSSNVVTRWGVASVTKVDDVTGAPLQGAKFEVYPAADPYATECAATPAASSTPIEVTEGGATATEFESDEYGVVRVPGLHISNDEVAGHRCYVFKETVAPVGYKLPTGGEEYTAVRVQPGSEVAVEPQKIVNAAIPAVVPVAPTVTQATCTVSGELTAPTVVLPVSSGIAYTLVGEVKAGSAVVVEARALEGYRLAVTDGWTVSDGVMSFRVLFDSINCQNQPAPSDPKSDLVNTGSDTNPYLWWGAGAALLLGMALVIANRASHRA